MFSRNRGDRVFKHLKFIDHESKVSITCRCFVIVLFPFYGKIPMRKPASSPAYNAATRSVQRPIVSSSHLVSPRSAQTSELEFGLVVAWTAFARCALRCMAAAGAPDLPTWKEKGVNFSAYTWYGIFVPVGTPQPVMDKLHKAITVAIDSKPYKDRMALAEGEIPHMSIAETKKFVDDDATMWRDLIKSLNIKLE